MHKTHKVQTFLQVLDVALAWVTFDRSIWAERVCQGDGGNVMCQGDGGNDTHHAAPVRDSPSWARRFGQFAA